LVRKNRSPSLMTIASASPLVCDGRRGGASCTFRSFRSSASATKRGVEVPSPQNGDRTTNGSARKVRREIDVLRDNLLLPNIDEAGRDHDAKDVRRSPSAWVQYYGTCAMKCQSPLPDVSVKAERDKLKSRALCNSCASYGAPAKGSSLCRTTDRGCEFGYSAAHERRKTMWKMRRVVSLSDR
jgi:hypothetical protein